MMKKESRPLFLVLLAVVQLLVLLGPSELRAAETAKGDDDAEKKAPLEETESVTHHSITIDGARIAYTSTAGTLLLKNEEGETQASIFYVAHIKDEVGDPATRPLTFSFNGGPGSAAVWVQLGAFGPKKILADPEGMPMPPPGKLVTNPYSVLDVTDLVFIDPVSTGYSRPASEEDGKKFHSLRGDIESVGEFIRLWTTRNQRWASPKFIAGESYGTTRSAGLALHLQERHGMYLNGLVMISSILNWQNQEMHPGNDTAFAIHLPSYAATAWYHGKLPPELSGDLRATLDEVEAFAIGDYAAALIQGDWLPAEERKEIAERVARYTGLSQDYVERTNLRIAIWRFVKELLRDEGKTVGRLDTRFTGFDRDSAGERFEFDPASEAVNVGYVTMLNDHLRRDLGYETDLPYRSSARLWRDWTWDDNENRYVNVAEDLRQAMTRNPELRVLFTSGYYDLATPYFDTPFSVAHLGLPEELRDNVSIAYYEAGHMMYIREVDHAKFKKDVADFIRLASAPATSVEH
ncbi:MAG: peptidase S10 [Thermoanaerobaculia bacterium]